jgi:hypothetical protein
VRALSSKVKDLGEQVFELENQLKDEEQQATLAKQEWTNRQQLMERELSILREAKDDLTKANN